ncbi:UDP-N-acetylglucosamine--N-acetylmuramyl-(pentapeptide) pyrophosphoryl-undecaprenol N-acetylglucosamine transferase [Nitrosococcus halophilus Nc 4]|uniref:UDP-N-acetylglucosamine--N-acetylmuramyl-(pentapeptide) pyrophosphoryl-undecaprenol N-acetylglucosamine transferase n=1 Tax=Nitrosococcus halophilus (strain Nc4) TaxID=472759 RepID=D5BW26_NITHN|nr:undecaprenyldiphospho-muramoylpentapeptide beta-N-acetylglucosaminyltransferase [Nitrosococcus halophilus]ADE13676.1 UDP-N-acetylglucosamine--N-acetylmuramyl-(pentapeptide) pyrophosphoryl-undecaprenol N-acetylglucosamine transferase [Nitrosococcus halophilus Nc 4]
MRATRVLIMAGGTGGHVFPALAVADTLRAWGVEVVWMGTHQGLEAELVPKAGYPMEWISIGGLRGKGWANWLRAPFKLLLALFQALNALRRQQPTVVLGLGGFASGPGGLGAWLLGRPLLIHEQNAIAGTTNRLLSHLACRVMEAFPGTFPAAMEAECTGNPVREGIEALPEPQTRFQDRRDRFRLLVLGGSQGARVLNEMLPQALALLPPEARPQVWHQCGPRQWEKAVAAYRAAGVESRLVPFIDEMAEAYAWADLVLCRAGALTIAELMAAGIGSLLVPFPLAIDDHQRANADYLVDAGAALLLPEKEVTPQRLAGEIERLGGDRFTLMTMAQIARQLHRVGAARRVAERCLEVARG